MSFNAIRENKILAKFFEFTVYRPHFKGAFFSYSSTDTFLQVLYRGGFFEHTHTHTHACTNARARVSSLLRYVDACVLSISKRSISISNRPV